MSRNGDAALDYLRRGWPVVPAIEVNRFGVCLCSKGAQCDSPGKHPRVKWKPYQTALPSEDEVRKWWRLWPNSSVIAIMGAFSGKVAVDIDPRHDGDESLRDLGPLPDTLTNLTGGGGQHLIYRHPGYEMRNAAGLLPGVDFRGDGGYIIVPPSVHSSGREYAWDLGQPDEPAALPEVIAKLHSRSLQTVGDDPASSSRRFDAEKMLTEPIAEGRRNETLVRIAGHYAADGRPYHDLLRTVLGCNYDLCQPPLGREEVVALVESIFNAEQKKRQLTEAVEHQLNGGSGEEIPDKDARAMAAQAWSELGIPNVTDWYIILGDTVEYVLVTDEDEARLGDDLLNQAGVRRSLLNQIKGNLRTIERTVWPKRAYLLRCLAREVYSEPTKAAEKLEEWIAAYTHDLGPALEPPIDERLAVLTTRPAVIDGRLHLKPEGFVRFLEFNLAEKIKVSDLRKLLKRAGWESTVVRSGNSTTRAWAFTYTRENETLKNEA